MDIQFFGGNCVVLSNKQVRIVVDDNLADLGGKAVVKEGDTVLFTGSHGQPAKPAKIIIDQPGEYEVQGVTINGVAARGHMDEGDQKTATMYKIISDDISVLVVGHIYPELNEAQLETIGMVDVMIVPLGGHGYTLDATGALALIKEMEPKLVIPTHYADPELQFPVPQSDLTEALKNLAMEPKETASKLRIRPADLTDVTQLILLEKS